MGSGKDRENVSVVITDILLQISKKTPNKLDNILFALCKMINDKRIEESIRSEYLAKLYRLFNEIVEEDIQ